MEIVGEKTVKTKAQKRAKEMKGAELEEVQKLKNRER